MDWFRVESKANRLGFCAKLKENREISELANGFLKLYIYFVEILAVFQLFSRNCGILAEKCRQKSYKSGNFVVNVKKQSTLTIFTLSLDAPSLQFSIFLFSAYKPAFYGCFPYFPPDQPIAPLI